MEKLQILFANSMFNILGGTYNKYYYEYANKKLTILGLILYNCNIYFNKNIYQEIDNCYNRGNQGPYILNIFEVYKKKKKNSLITPQGNFIWKKANRVSYFINYLFCKYYDLKLLILIYFNKKLYRYF